MAGLRLSPLGVTGLALCPWLTYGGMLCRLEGLRFVWCTWRGSVVLWERAINAGAQGTCKPL